MHTLDVTIGEETFFGLLVPEACTVIRWKILVRLGFLGEAVPGAERVACRDDEGGPLLGDDAPLPAPPAVMHITGPAETIQALKATLRRVVGCESGAKASDGAPPEWWAGTDYDYDQSWWYGHGADAAGSTDWDDQQTQGKVWELHNDEEAWWTSPGINQDAEDTISVRRALTGEMVGAVPLDSSTSARSLADLLSDVLTATGPPTAAAQLFLGTKRLYLHERPEEIGLCPGDVIDVMFTDFQVVTSSASGRVEVWRGRDCVKSFLGHDVGAVFMGSSAGGDTIVTGSSVDRMAKVWRLVDEDYRCMHEFPVPSQVFSVALSPEGSQIVVGCGDGIARVWRLEDGACSLELGAHLGVVYYAAWAHDGGSVVTASTDATVKIWDTEFGECMETLDAHRSIVRCAVFSPDDKMVATCSRDRTAKLWRVRSGLCIYTFGGHSGEVVAVTFSPDGSKLATSSVDCAVKVWHASLGHLLLTLEGHEGAVRSASFSSDGRAIVSASSDGTARIWDAEHGSCLYALADVRERSMTCAAFTGG